MSVHFGKWPVNIEKKNSFVYELFVLYTSFESDFKWQINLFIKSKQLCTSAVFSSHSCPGFAKYAMMRNCAFMTVYLQH